MSKYYSIYKSIVKIKDKIYDYITLTNIEYDILETNIFQRLRNISQSGFIHTVYPGNRISRFEHSLGCMHLAGLFIENMFSNSSSSSQLSIVNKGTTDITIRESFLNEFVYQYSINKDEKNELKKYIEKLINQSKTFTHFQVVEAIIWESVRLTGLLHDLGHLPFSHDLEIIINKNLNLLDLSNDKKKEYLRYYNGKYHEFATISLINTKSIIDCFKGHEPLHKIILKIFNSKINQKKNNLIKKENRNVFYTLKEIVDSDVDADRGDYIKRDGISSGVEMGNYDLSRIIQNMELMMNEKKEFFIRPTQYASSIVEQFLLERYRVYKYVHFHQKSVFVNTLLSRIVSYLLVPELYNINIKIKIDATRLNYINYILTDCNKKIFSEPFDDITIISFFRKVYGELIYKEKNNNINANEDFLKRIIEIILFRKKNYISLWKKNEDYYELYNNKIKPVLETKFKNLSLNQLSINYLSDLSSIESLEKIINNYIPENMKARIIIAPKHLSLFKDDYFIINTKYKKWEKLYIREFAPLLSYAKNVWENSVQVFCYAILKNEINKNENPKYIKILTESLTRGLADWIDNLTSFNA